MSSRAPVRGGVRGTTFSPGVVARVSDPNAPNSPYGGWMGPGTPLRPVLAPGTYEPRTWDYPNYRNIGRPPRDDGTGTGVTFDQLRAVADNCTLVRLCIDTRKDQISKLDYDFRLKPMPGELPGDTNDRSEKDPRIAYLREFFKYPDRKRTFTQWIRSIIEDALVTDAVTIYRRPTLGGDVYALEAWDGSTINVIIDDTGRMPQGVDPATGKPATAYQQWIKNVPVDDFAAGELLYYPRNVRTHHVYGYSPVEQLIVYINLALRRTMMQGAFYTDGNLPGALFATPDTWQPDTIKRFQDYWDSMLAGDDARRARGLFVPSGTKLLETRADILKDEWDEWLARVVCFCFSISPNFFIKQMNRASAQTFWDQANEEGLVPWMDYAAEVVNEAIRKPDWWGWDDIEFGWQPELEESAEKQVVIDTNYVNSGIWTVNEVRERQGMDPIEGGDVPRSGGGGPGGMYEPPKPSASNGPNADESPDEQVAQKLAGLSQKKTARSAFSRAYGSTRRARLTKQSPGHSLAASPTS